MSERMFYLTSNGNCPSPRVLVVEDDPTHRDVIETFLNPQSYFVDFASDGSEGLEMALTRSYDVILTDLRMPKMTGDKMVQELRRHPHLLGNCQIAVMSTDPYDVTGVSAYLQKPFRRSELKTLVDEQASIAFDTRRRQGNKALQNKKPTIGYDIGGMPRLVWGEIDNDFGPDPRLMHSSAMQRKEKKWRIMLIFEDKEESNTLATFLKFHGFEIHVTTTEVGRSSFTKEDFHLILADHSIDKATIQLARTNSTKVYMPIMMLAQSSLPAEHVDFLLTKPIDSGSLVYTLSTVAQMVSEERHKVTSSPYAALRRFLASFKRVIPPQSGSDLSPFSRQVSTS